ncbi:acyltransferase family protein [Neorhizobium vignae]|jgi:peptidoglycan/LPS O-acetylase OafA/YrhL|uniref:acyltransferase family protein n=1 Tax=Neorhizobium vignae TaxID=690585 RepID=UPI0005662B1D|nr:acyltransferase [Neorhizobium vignae]
MNETARVTPGSHIPELDGIRGAAVLSVVVLHTTIGLLSPDFTYPSLNPLYRIFFGGGIGVDLFFVLSGFLIGGILIDHKDTDNYFKVFWVRRAARILPVYLLLMATYLIAKQIGQSVNAPWFHSFLMNDPLPIWTYLTFTQNNYMALTNNGGALWVGITWSLAVEEQFYLLFPFVVYFFSKKTVMKIAVITLIVAYFSRLYLWKNYSFYVGYFPTQSRADALMFGVLAAYLVRSSKLQWLADRRILFDIIAMAAIAILMWKVKRWIGDSGSFSLRCAVFAYAIVRIFITDGLYRKFFRSRFMVFMGLISYSFYMYHQAINGLFHGLLLGQGPRIENWAGLAVGIAVFLTSAGLATLSTRYYEKPFRDIGRRFRYRRASDVPTAGAAYAQ